MGNIHDNQVLSYSSNMSFHLSSSHQMVARLFFNWNNRLFHLHLWLLQMASGCATLWKHRSLINQIQPYSTSHEPTRWLPVFVQTNWFFPSIFLLFTSNWLLSRYVSQLQLNIKSSIFWNFKVWYILNSGTIHRLRIKCKLKKWYSCWRAYLGSGFLFGYRINNQVVHKLLVAFSFVAFLNTHD